MVVVCVCVCCLQSVRRRFGHQTYSVNDSDELDWHHDEADDLETQVESAFCDDGDDGDDGDDDDGAEMLNGDGDYGGFDDDGFDDEGTGDDMDGVDDEIYQLPSTQGSSHDAKSSTQVSKPSGDGRIKKVFFMVKLMSIYICRN